MQTDTTSDTDLSTLSAAETARLVAQKELSPVETIMAAIDRIEARNPALNAVIFKDYDGAITQAKAQESAIMKGEATGPLAGVPTLTKDLFDFKAGWPSTLGGIPELAQFIPDFTSSHIERTEKAGAIYLGKTNAPAMGYRAVTDNLLFGATGNPFDLIRNSGGSSGGSAAAVGDGMVPIAGASDGGGSIRIPAAFCGLVGYQSSHGVVPIAARPNAFGNTAPFIYVGNNARTVEDAALGMAAIAGHDPADPYSFHTNVDFVGALRRSIKGLRIGVSDDLGLLRAEPEVEAAVRKAAAAFAEAGAIVEDVTVQMPADLDTLREMWSRMVCANTLAAFDGFKPFGLDILGNHRDSIPIQLAEAVEAVARSTLVDIQADQTLRSAIYDAFHSLFAQYDLIVAPTTTCIAPKNAAERGMTFGPDNINGVPTDPLIGYLTTFLTNMTGNPSVSLPAGLVDGMPVGMMVIGRRGADETLISAAATFEQLRPWRHIYDIPAKRT